MIETIERLGEGATFIASWTRVWWRRLRRELADLPAELRRVRAARRPAA